MSIFWTDTVSRLTPYVPGEQRSGHDVVKLNTNENPYPPSPKVIEAIKSVDGEHLRRYPDPESVALRRSLADYHQLSPEQVFVGNGSDEILALAFLAFFTNKRYLQFPDISYSFYPVYCNLYGIEQKVVPLEADYSLNLSRFSVNEGGIVFPNPNAPTALALSSESIEQFLNKHTEQILLVDEAYAGFGADSVVDLVKRYPNLLVSHTFSKGRSLAGMRLGVAFGDVGLIDALQRIKNSFNSYPIDCLAQAAGQASIEDEPYYQRTTQRIVQTRSMLVSELEKRNFRVLPSSANFVFAKVPNSLGGAKVLFDKLNQESILVRYWPKPRLDAWLRISIGTDEQTQRLLECIDR